MSAHSESPAGPWFRIASFRRRLAEELLAHRRALAGFLAVSLLLNLCGLVVPWLTQVILDRAVPSADLPLLTRLAAIMVLITAFQLILAMWRRLILVRTSMAIDRVLLGLLCSHVLSLPASFFRARQTGDIVARFNDGAQVRSLLAGSLTRSLIDLIMVGVYFGVMVYYSFPLALLVLGILVVFTVYTAFISPLIRRLHRRLLADKAAQEAHLIEMVSGIDLVKASSREQFFHQRWASALDRYLQSSYSTQKLRQILECGGSAIKFLCTLGVIGYGAFLVMRGELTTGALVAFTMYAGEALLPLIRLIAVWDELQEARVALERVEELMALPPEPEPAPEMALHVGRIQGKIQIDDVYFDYGGPSPFPVLQGVSFEIRAGDHVALVGPSGSGKTTLARLLLGLYRPTRGRIFIDGRDLAHFGLREYRQQVGVVLQENLILRGTIRENIVLGDPEPDPDRIREAAVASGAHAFIAKMPEGYNTIVGEMGLTLSGGQRQRLSIARALYRNSRILIFDEATNALDQESAEAIQINLSQVLADSTALIIAHNFATLRQVGRILVLENGRVTEAKAGDLSAWAGSRDRPSIAVRSSPHAWGDGT